MAKCPHCGESVKPSQETCFACGQKIRSRVRRGEQPVNAAIFVLAGVLILAGVVGAIFVVAGRAKRSRAEIHQQELTRIQDSVRAANRARRETERVEVRDDETARLTDELDKLEQRFNLVRQQVVKDQPSPEQSKLIGQIRTEVSRLRQLAAGVSAQPGPKADSIKGQIRDEERIVRDLISDLTRAPKK